MSATRIFHDGVSIPAFAAILAAFAFVVDVIRETARLRHRLSASAFEQD